VRKWIRYKGVACKRLLQVKRVMYEYCQRTVCQSLCCLCECLLLVLYLSFAACICTWNLLICFWIILLLCVMLWTDLLSFCCLLVSCFLEAAVVQDDHVVLELMPLGALGAVLEWSWAVLERSEAILGRSKSPLTPQRPHNNSIISTLHPPKSHFDKAMKHRQA